MRVTPKRSASRFMILLAAVTLMAPLAVWYDPAFQGYVENWFGTVAQACMGASLGYLISRGLTKLDLSDYKVIDHRLEAGKTQALYIVGMALAVALG